MQFKFSVLAFLAVAMSTAYFSAPAAAHTACRVDFPFGGGWTEGCPHPHPHVDPLAEVAGESGRGIYVEAAAVMAARAQSEGVTGQPLDSELKTLLRPHFGNLVDRVRIFWGVMPLDKIGGGNTQISWGSAGQTFGHNIYIRYDEPGTYSEGMLNLVIHEMVHSAQYEKWSSSLSNFGYHYFKAWWRVGRNYANNPHEREADSVAEQIIAAVYPSSVEVPIQQDVLPGAPVAQGQWGSIRSGHVLTTMPDGRVLDWVPADGSWRLWNYIL